MPEILRQIEEKDFYNVSKLYSFRKEIGELKWLYTDIHDITRYNAFVAENEKNEIVGVIGYSISKYEQGENNFLGIIPMTWKLSEDYKGLAGVLLFKKILSLTDVGIAIAGSDKAKELYPLFKFEHHSDIYIKYNVLNYRGFYQSLKGKNKYVKVGLVSYMFIQSLRNKFLSINSSDIHFEEYKTDNYKPQNYKEKILAKKISKNYIDWLLKCPKLDSYAYHISFKKEYKGVCIIYIEMKNGIRKGRVVHLPYLGNDIMIWKKVISKIVDFCKKKDCCLVTGLAHNAENNLGFIKSGFVDIKGHKKPLYIRDSKKVIETFDIKNWFIQYSESDKAYRDI